MRRLGTILGIAVGVCLLAVVSASAEGGRVSLSLESMLLATSAEEAFEPAQWNLETQPVWNLDVPKSHLADEVLSAGEDPMGYRHSQVSLERKINPDLHFSLAVAMFRQPLRSLGRKESYGAASAASSKPSADLIEDDNAVAVSVGIDWRVYGRQGLHLGYLYGADPMDNLAGELDPLGEKKQSLDLAYSYYMDGLYFSLGYIYTFSPLLEADTGEYGAEDVLDDSAVYLRFQLRF